MKNINLLDYTPTLFYFTESAKNEFAYNVEEARLQLRGSGSTCFICSTCGAAFKTGIIARHLETNEPITMGLDCADTLDLAHVYAQSKGEIEMLRNKTARNKRAIAAELYREKHSDLVGFLESQSPSNSFARSLLDSIAGYGQLTGGQYSAAVRMMERHQEELTQKKIACPVGRQRFTGVVVSIKKPSVYAEYPSFKAIIKVLDGDEYYTVMGNITSAMDDIDRGDTVTMTATIKKSDRDPSFGFYSRPSKVEISK